MNHRVTERPGQGATEMRAHCCAVFRCFGDPTHLMNVTRAQRATRTDARAANDAIDERRGRIHSLPSGTRILANMRSAIRPDTALALLRLERVQLCQITRIS
jgi:hypothetical protein